MYPPELLNFICMKAILLKLVFAAGSLLASLSAYTQCEILYRIYPDGSMQYYIEPVNFYWTQSKDLKGGVETDMENYYLALQPSPFPNKPLGHKLKDDLELTLSNDSIYHLKHFDTRYMDHDTVMQMLFLIDKKDLQDYLKYEAISVKINMGDTEGIRTYVFKLHKSAIQEQLSCFLKEEENKKKK
jgi:hypothetical protein